jgi:hypothetical protein
MRDIDFAVILSLDLDVFRQDVQSIPLRFELYFFVLHLLRLALPLDLLSPVL